MTKAFKTDVQLLPKELDEKVVKLHLPALGAELTVLTREQAVFMVVEAQGPFKDPHKRYGAVRFSRWSCVVHFIFTVLHGVTVLASGRLLNLLPVQLDVRPQVDRFVFPDVHRTVFAQEHADYIGIKVEG